MASSPRHNRLTRLQRDLLDAFFAREQRMFLTGRGALAGFHLGHRETEDLDLVSPPELDLREPTHALIDAAAACGAMATPIQAYPDFRRLKVVRGAEDCIVDLVVDRAPMIEAEKSKFGSVRVDTLREIAANKICTLMSRSEIKDVVDLRALLEAGADLERALDDAQKKEAGADPATLAWILGELTIGPEVILPGGVTPSELLSFRDELVPRLRAIAFDRARRS
jgi:hypothetical protein